MLRKVPQLLWQTPHLFPWWEDRGGQTQPRRCDQQQGEEAQPGCEPSMGMNQRILKQQLCVTTKVSQGTARKHKQDGPTQGWGQREGGRCLLRPFPSS